MCRDARLDVKDKDGCTPLEIAGFHSAFDAMVTTKSGARVVKSILHRLARGKDQESVEQLKVSAK